MKKFVVALALVAFFARSAFAQSEQRRITPVKPATNTVLRPEKGTKEEVIRRYLAGDTVSAKAEERKDSLRRIYPHYPAITDVTVGINFLEPVLMAFGQKHAGVDVSVTLNMWNRVQPVIELGMGYAKDTPEDMNYTYKSPLSPFARLGVNYNFLFKSEPKYNALVGVRIGCATFKYDITDATHWGGYWGEKKEFSIMGEKSNALWGEFLAGVRVGLWKNLSMGWQVKYHGIFSYKKTPNSSPWFIPGYGARNRHWAFSFSFYYTIPLSKGKWPQTDKDEPKN